MVLGLIGCLLAMLGLVWGVFFRGFLIGSVVGMILMVIALEFWHER